MSDKSMIVKDELISKPQRIAASKFKYLKTWPKSNPTQITVAGRTKVEFEIPTEWINYKRSLLRGKITIPQPGAAGQYNRYHAASVAFISSVSFKLRTGEQLINQHPYVQNWSRICLMYDKHMDEVMGNDIRNAIFPYRSEQNPTGNYRRVDNSTISHPNVEPQYIVVGGDNQILEYEFSIPLSDILPHTLFAKGHDIKFPSIGWLAFELGPGNRFAWVGTDATNPATGAAPTANLTIANLHLMLAVNDDPVYTTMLEHKMESGYTIILDDVVCQQVQKDGTKHTVEVTFNGAHGKRLKRIYHAMFSSNEQNHSSLNNNMSNTLVSYRVSINDRPTTDEDIYLNLNSDYITAFDLQKPLLEGTVVTNADIYNHNFVHIEDVGRLGSPAEQVRSGTRPDDVIGGYDLTKQDYKFSFVANFAANTILYHYTFAVVQRELHIKGNQVILT